MGNPALTIFPLMVIHFSYNQIAFLDFKSITLFQLYLLMSLNHDKIQEGIEIMTACFPLGPHSARRTASVVEQQSFVEHEGGCGKDDSRKTLISL